MGNDGLRRNFCVMNEENTVLDTVIEVGISLLVGYTISRFVRIALARGESMLPTIRNNQPILLDCRAYQRREPKRQDLIVFKAHQKNQPKLFLKRVIAIPGDHLKIIRGKVYLNGELLNEPYLNEEMRRYEKIDLIIDEGHLFVMGDNRNHSLDSRATSLGQINIKKDVVGVVKQFRK